MKSLASLVFLLLLVPACRADVASIGPADAEAEPQSIKIEPGSPKLAFVKVETVTEAEAGTSLALTGRVGFDEDHTQRVSSPIDGRATSLLVRPGDRVKVGQALIQLSSPHVAELQSDAQKAEQDLTLAQKTVDRAHILQKDGAISEKEVSQVESDYRKAKAQLAGSTAQLRSLGLSASTPTVTAALRAQVAGTVVERNVLVGQEVRADSSSPLITISDLDTVWVLADVYEQDLKLVQPNAPVSVSVPAYPGEKFLGKVAHIGEVLDPQSHTVKLRCVLPNLDGRLKPEMFAKIELSDAAGAKVIMIPSKAVLADSEHARVIIDAGNGIYKARVVTVGPEVEGKVRVLSGLAPGERVVTEGALFLKGDIDNQ